MYLSSELLITWLTPSDSLLPSLHHLTRMIPRIPQANSYPLKYRLIWQLWSKTVQILVNMNRFWRLNCQSFINPDVSVSSWSSNRLSWKERVCHREARNGIATMISALAEVVWKKMKPDRFIPDIFLNLNNMPEQMH